MYQLIIFVCVSTHHGWVLADLVEPLGRDGLHGAPHERVYVEDGVEVLHRQREQVAVGLCPDTGHALRVRQEADFWKEQRLKKVLHWYI